MSCFCFCRIHPAALAILLCAPVAALSAAAQAPALALAAALQRAELQHPLFESWRAQLRAAEGRRIQAGVRPAPQLDLTVEDVLGTGSIAGLSGMETTIGFSQLIERGGLRDRRIDAADAQRDRLVTEALLARLDVRAEVARRFVHVLSDQAQLAITRESTRLAQRTLDEVERRVQAARAPEAERSRATVSVQRAQLEEEHAEHELAASRRHLAAAMGSMEADFGVAEGDLLRLPAVAEFETLLAQLREAPDGLLYAREADLRAAELRLAQARRSPGVTLGAGLRRLEASDDLGLVFSASLPLFSAKRERGNLLERAARLAEVAPEREQALLQAQARLYEIYQELKHAGLEFETQHDRVVPLIEQALRQTQEAYALGRYSLLELRDAQTEWTTQRRRLIEAAAEYHGYLIEIQRLTGAPAPVIDADERSQP